MNEYSFDTDKWLVDDDGGNNNKWHPHAYIYMCVFVKYAVNVCRLKDPQAYDAYVYPFIYS